LKNEATNVRAAKHQRREAEQVAMNYFEVGWNLQGPPEGTELDASDLGSTFTRRPTTDSINIGHMHSDRKSCFIEKLCTNAVVRSSGRNLLMYRYFASWG
jgi:hypothetical protein